MSFLKIFIFFRLLEFLYPGILQQLPRIFSLIGNILAAKPGVLNTFASSFEVAHWCSINKHSRFAPVFL
jgi:hypothetical protein